jgi:hypothetical protein
LRGASGTEGAPKAPGDAARPAAGVPTDAAPDPGPEASARGPALDAAGDGKAPAPAGPGAAASEPTTTSEAPASSKAAPKEPAPGVAGAPVPAARKAATKGWKPADRTVTAAPR